MLEGPDCVNSLTLSNCAPPTSKRKTASTLLVDLLTRRAFFRPRDFRFFHSEDHCLVSGSEPWTALIISAHPVPVDGEPCRL